MRRANGNVFRHKFFIGNFFPANFDEFTGEPLKLHCRVDGLPAPEVVWTKDEIRIDEWMMEKEVTIRYYPDGTCEMTKAECAPEDAGLYRLTARNRYGTAETAAYVHVEGKLFGFLTVIQVYIMLSME